MKGSSQAYVILFFVRQALLELASRCFHRIGVVIGVVASLPGSIPNPSSSFLVVLIIRIRDDKFARQAMMLVSNPDYRMVTMNELLIQILAA